MRIVGGHSVRASDVTTRAAQLMALLTRRPGPPETDTDTERSRDGSVSRLRQAGAVHVLEAIIADASPFLGCEKASFLFHKRFLHYSCLFLFLAAMQRSVRRRPWQCLRPWPAGLAVGPRARRLGPVATPIPGSGSCFPLKESFGAAAVS